MQLLGCRRKVANLGWARARLLAQSMVDRLLAKIGEVLIIISKVLDMFFVDFGLDGMLILLSSLFAGGLMN